MTWQDVGPTLTVGGQNFNFLPNGTYSFRLKFGFKNSILTSKKVILRKFDFLS